MTLMRSNDLTLQVVVADERQWETPNYLAHYEQMFLVGLLERISMYIGEGNVRRYHHLIELGLVAVHEYNYFNRHVFLTSRGRQIARQLKWEFTDIVPYVKWAMDLYRVIHSEYMIMVYGDKGKLHNGREYEVGRI